jgi:transketolase
MAGHMRLDRLIVLFDDNGISIDGSTDLAVSEDTTGRFAAYGWQVLAVDGHDMDAVSNAITAAKQETGKPTLIRCRTVIGFGAPKKAGTSGVHGAPLGADEIAGTRAALGWTHAPFEIPDDIMTAWRAVGSRGAATRAAWQDRHTAADSTAFDTAIAGDYSAAVNEAPRRPDAFHSDQQSCPIPCWFQFLM